MPNFRLDGTRQRVQLGGGYAITVTNIVGNVRAGGGRGERAREFGTADFDAMLEAAGLARDKVIMLDVADVGGMALGRGIAAAAPGAEVVVDVPTAPETMPVILLEDESGAVSWHFPEGGPAPATGARALGATTQFRIPVMPRGGGVGARGLGGIGGKLLKVFTFPVSDLALGPIVHGFAGLWEKHNRPYLVRRYGPADYTRDQKDFPGLTEADWQRLAGGRALLFVHGTFSTCGAFSALPADVMGELSARYGGRTFAFNHFTLTAEPRENALEFLRRIPAGVHLDVDIVCHSRGGLVARELAALGGAPGGGTSGTLQVGKIVLVGVPNAGTALADDDHMVELIDRFTNIVKFIPAGPVKAIIDAVVTAVKVVGHGFLHDLEGLRAMNPRGPFLPQLNVPGAVTPELFAIASDFEPGVGTPWFSLTRAEDGAADRVFGDAANDLVVPRDGVFAGNGATGFPIPDERCRKFEPADGVIHTEYFSKVRTHQWLLDWLTGAPATSGRAVADVAGSAAHPAPAPETLAEVARRFDAVRDYALAFLAQPDAAASRAAAGRARDLSPDELAALRPHVVNLSEGTFKRSGSFDTTQEDVDAIFRDHIPDWATQRPTGEPLRLVLFAHGGLVGEKAGLEIARKHVDWWKSNGVYPIYFVWETGLFDAVRSILESVGRRVPGVGARDIFDYTTDPLVEAGCHALGGVQIWGAMKHNAELASAGQGGARYVAKQLAEFCGHAARPVELHAVGHSAGSIFHSHFLPAVRDAGMPGFKTLQFLAPAIRVDAFKDRLLNEIGRGVERLTIFTMRRDYETRDNCIGIYHKSLLYLIYHALEPQRDTPILGLEISLTTDPALRRLLGLDGRGGAPGEVVWSVTQQSGGRSASQSTSHGGFDDDPATMSSVVARVLDVAAAPVPYQGTGRGREWQVASDWMDAFDITGLHPTTPAAVRPHVPAAPEVTSEPAVTAGSRPDGNGAGSCKAGGRLGGLSGTVSSGATGKGRRIALCVGIDAYPAPNTLTGCVNDAKLWARVLKDTLHFDTVDILINADATHAEITDRLRRMVDDARLGDVLVFQYSGHGTQVPDDDGDEEDQEDEALVPVDFDDGAFLIDDDLRTIFSRLPAGVALTCFIDCCHSGTITRMLGRTGSAPDRDGTPRFLVPTEEQIQAYARFRREQSSRGLVRAFVDRTVLRWVDFSACDATEVALERDGNGDFTRRAVAVLQAGVDGVSNHQFQRRVVEAFGEHRQQTPQLDCPIAAEDLPMFTPVPAPATPPGGDSPGSVARPKAVQ